jgi:hypothetical protein
LQGQTSLRSAAWRAALLLGLLVFARAAPASAQTETDERVWINVILQSRTDRPTPWRWSVENIVRTRDGVSTIDNVGLRPIVNYVIDKHSTVGGGYAYVEYSPATIGLVEHRLFEQYIWTGSLAGGTLAVRNRLEQRFTDGNSGVAARLREQVRFSHPVKPGSHISIVGYDEFFLHLNTTTLTQKGLDQNRIFGGISDSLNRTVRFEVGYVNQFVKRHDTPSLLNHVLSGTLVFSF